MSDLISTDDKIEAAMCLWEVYLNGQGSELHQELLPLIGTAQMRNEIARDEVISACHNGWEFLSENHGYDDMFDWHFCEVFLEECVSFTNEGYAAKVVLRNDWLKRLMDALSADNRIEV
jgi:hypothetical protein